MCMVAATAPVVLDHDPIATAWRSRRFSILEFLRKQRVILLSCGMLVRFREVRCLTVTGMLRVLVTLLLLRGVTTSLIFD